MTKRKYIPKKTRVAVYNKLDGHCAYCGKKIEYKDMQLDHLIPKQRERFKRYTEEEIECFENYFPSCRRCNHMKRAYSLEGFREAVETIPKKLFRDNYIYKVGLDYNLIEVHERPIKFYFERVAETEVKKEDF